MKLKFGTLQTKQGLKDRVYLIIFEHTSLVRTSFIETLVLEQLFKYKMLGSGISLDYWNEKK